MLESCLSSCLIQRIEGRYTVREIGLCTGMARRASADAPINAVLTCARIVPFSSGAVAIGLAAFAIEGIQTARHTQSAGIGYIAVSAGVAGQAASRARMANFRGVVGVVKIQVGTIVVNG